MQITCTQKEFVKILKQKNLAECHDLFIQSDTFLLADVFQNFRNMFLLMYKLDPAKFILFTEEINKSDLSSNGDKRMQSIDSI